MNVSQWGEDDSFGHGVEIHPTSPLYMMFDSTQETSDFDSGVSLSWRGSNMSYKGWERTYLQSYSAAGGRCFKTQFKKLNAISHGYLEFKSSHV